MSRHPHAYPIACGCRKLGYESLKKEQEYAVRIFGIVETCFCLLALPTGYRKMLCLEFFLLRLFDELLQRRGW